MEVPYEPEKWRKGENLPKVQGLVLGSIERAGKLYALVDTGDVHCLMIGAAGVGKTAHFLYPNIEYACACGMSFLTTDTKGDLYRNYAGIAQKYYGYHTAVIDLRNPTRSDGDNMLHLVNKYMDQYLADHTNLSAKERANKEGTCYPAIGTIARDLHLSASTVKRAVSDLEKDGFIRKKQRWRENGGRSSLLFEILK